MRLHPRLVLNFQLCSLAPSHMRVEDWILSAMAGLSSLPESLNSFTSGDSETAQAKIKIVDQSLSCPVCLERYRDPRLLTCNHSFCRACLEDIVTRRHIDEEYPVGEC